MIDAILITLPILLVGGFLLRKIITPLVRQPFAWRRWLVAVALAMVVQIAMCAGMYVALSTFGLGIAFTLVLLLSALTSWTAYPEGFYRSRRGPGVWPRMGPPKHSHYYFHLVSNIAGAAAAFVAAMVMGAGASE